MDWNLINTILFGKQPPGRMREGWDDLSHEGLTMGTLYIGRQGTGKTSSLARHVVDYFLRYQDRAIFILDWSGSITDSLLTLICQQEEAIRQRAVKRLVYDELGNPDVTIPMPEFSTEYGPYEEQVQRVSQNLVKLSPHLVENAPILGGAGVKGNRPADFQGAVLDH